MGLISSTLLTRLSDVFSGFTLSCFFFILLKRFLIRGKAFLSPLFNSRLHIGATISLTDLTRAFCTEFRRALSASEKSTGSCPTGSYCLMSTISCLKLKSSTPSLSWVWLKKEVTGLRPPSFEIYFPALESFIWTGVVYCVSSTSKSTLFRLVIRLNKGISSSPPSWSSIASIWSIMSNSFSWLAWSPSMTRLST